MKIICHGDSLTEGNDIEKAYTWTSLLEDGVHPAKDGHRVMGVYAAKLIKDVFHFA